MSYFVSEDTKHIRKLNSTYLISRIVDIMGQSARQLVSQQSVSLSMTGRLTSASQSVCLSSSSYIFIHTATRPFSKLIFAHVDTISIFLLSNYTIQTKYIDILIYLLYGINRLVYLLIYSTKYNTLHHFFNT